MLKYLDYISKYFLYIMKKVKLKNSHIYSTVIKCLILKWLHLNESWRLVIFWAEVWSQDAHLNVWSKGWFNNTAFIWSRFRSQTSISRTWRPLKRLRRVRSWLGRIWIIISWTCRTVSESGLRRSKLRMWSQSSRIEQSCSTSVSNT